MRLNGVDFPACTVVSAWTNGVQHAETLNVNYFPGQWYLSLPPRHPGDDTDPLAIESGTERQMIVFRVVIALAAQMRLQGESSYILPDLSANVPDLTISKDDGQTSV